MIAAELADWLRSQGIKDTLSYDRIIGCPHEEGIDYPIGRTCPQCPFWAGIDRFTHEPISAPVAKMSPDQVLIELGKDRTTHPLEALESADAHRGVLAQPLLQVLERCVTDPDSASEADAQLFCYALYLMAKWRETRAYPLVIRWLSLPDAASTRLSGDVLTQDGARILAAVCDGDLEPIKRLVLNRDADEFSRGVAVAALALLAVWAEVPRDTILDHFAWLAREGLERQTELRVGRACRGERGYRSPRRLSRSSSGVRRGIHRSTGNWTLGARRGGGVAAGRAPRAHEGPPSADRRCRQGHILVGTFWKACLQSTSRGAGCAGRGWRFR